jgi:PAS domain S-box-containing protein
MIEEQKARLNSLINTADDILIFSLDRDFRYTSFNENQSKAMKKLWQTDIQLGMNYTDSITGAEQKAAAIASMNRTLAGEHFIEAQFQPQLGVWWEFNWNPIKNKDKVIGLSVFVKDITERRRSRELARGVRREF